MKENIIGREQEIEKLENYISSRKSEFIAIYVKDTGILKYSASIFLFVVINL